MTLLSEASFLVTPNGYKASKLYAALPVPVEIAVNGNFLTDTNWTKGAGWTIANGFATAIGNAFDLEQSFSFTNTATYTVKYTITDYAYGGIRVVLYSSGNTYGVGLTRTSNGVYTESITIQNTGGSASNTLKIQTTTTNESFKISNVSVKLDTDMTFTRATTATRVDENDLVSSVASNVPRIDYTGGGCPSILLEPQRTNLVTFSEQIDNAAWNKSNTSVTANQTTSPSGYDDADLIDALTGTGQHFISAASITYTNAVPYTFSVFAKKGNTSLIQLFGASGVFGTNVWATYNFDTLEVTTGSASTASMVDYGSGWYRLILTGTVTSANTVASFYAAFTNNKSVRLPSFTASNETFYLWGAQLEAGAYPTSYIPTTTATVTRNADAISKTGISDLIGQTEGVMFIESAALFNDLTQRGISISDGTGNNRLIIYYNSPSNQIFVWGVANGVLFPSGVSYSVTDETEFAKIAVRYRANDITLWVNGYKRGTDITSQALPINFSRFGFDSGTGITNLFAKVKSAQLYKTYLSDAQMAALTTL